MATYAPPRAPAPPVARGGEGSYRGGRGRVPRGGLQRAVGLLMAAVSSFFLALTYAYIARGHFAADWLQGPLASLLTLNTAVLLASSVALVAAQRRLRAGHIAAMLRWLTAAVTLGFLFLAGQAAAWKLLLGAGVYLAQFPDSGFFYLGTAAHAAHLAAALGLLVYVFALAWRGRLRPERPTAMELTAIVWHTLDLTWIYLYLVLLFWR